MGKTVQFTETRVILDAGDIVVFYTDGLTEAANLQPCHAACLISDSAGMPRPRCSFQAMPIVRGRVRFSTS